MKKGSKLLSLLLCLTLLLSLFTGCESKEEKSKKYIDSLTEYSVAYSSAVKDFNEEWKKADFKDAQWKTRVTEKIEKVEETIEKLNSLTPTDEYKKAQDKINEGTKKVSTAMQSFKDVAQKSNSSSEAIKFQSELIKNITLLSEASDLFGQANLEITPQK